MKKAKNLLSIRAKTEVNTSDQDTNIPTQNYYIPIPMQEEKNYDS